MSTVTQARLLTAEEFAQLPQPEDGSQQELVNGVVLTVPAPSFNHGQVCSTIGCKLGVFIDANQRGWITSNDSGVILAREPDTVRGPDLAFWSRERMPAPPQTGYPDLAPDLVVEVLSPSDVFPQILRKVQQYLRAGTREVWVVVPEDRSVTVCRPGQEQVILSNGETLSSGDILPGFSCPVAELFP
ncbi:MAG: Uma2 family endonuclease [Planctomycetes bacterium]|nr:Uma2 family endonuclease [Planctomycetota bacterium]